MNKEVEEALNKAMTMRPEVREINEEGINLIKQFEGFRPRSYLCPAGKWTIGYGTINHPDGFPVVEGETITEIDATKMLLADLEKREYLLNNFLIKNRIFLNENQFSALISFAYNCGMTPLIRKGTPYKGLMQKNLELVADGMLKYVKVTKETNFGVKYKKTLPGLVRRRKAEIELFWS